MKFRQANLTFLSFSCSILFTTNAFASNGFNGIGFGAESIGLGGADIAIAHDTSSLNTNPAGLAEIKQQWLDIYAAAVYGIDVQHRDNFGNDKEVDDRFVPVATLGYAHRLKDTRITFGVGAFAQGGTGYEYSNLNTAFGTRDDLTTQFRVAKVSGGVAYQINDALQAGFSVSAIYSDLEQKFFPETSFFNGQPENAFFGFRLKDVDGITYGYKIGVKYKVDNRQSIGFAFTPESDLKLNGGRLISNQSSIGLGKVTYRNAAVEGIKLPQEVGIGYAFEITPQLLFAAKLNWLDWSSAMKKSTLTFKNPQNPAAAPSVSESAKNDWRDQYVAAIGFAYQSSHQTVYRLGYNYGRNPIPNKHLNPLFATIMTQHFTAGFGKQITQGWHVDLGIEYSPNKKVSYTNPELPFGANAQEENEIVVVHLTFSKVL